MTMPIDYQSLRLIWWLLLGVLLIGFAIMDGFDLGAVIVMPFVAKNDLEKRMVINSVGPVWEGNQVWFILGGGAIFAAWPILYAVSFSGFYLAMMVALMLGFILRPVGFKYRSKMASENWRRAWDSVLFISGFVPALIFGVAIGNVLQGVPFHFDNTLRVFYTGSFFALLNPFALLCGVLSVAMLAMQGSSFLVCKTEGELNQRLIRCVRMTAGVVVLLFAVAGIWLALAVHGYHISGKVDHFGPSNPLHKTVGTGTGLWLANYKIYPWTTIAPALGFIGALLAVLLSPRGHGRLGFIASSISVFGLISTVGVSMFPFLLPSSSNPSMSLLVWDASSSQLTLFIMLCATVIFLPIILLYTSWVYRIMRGKVTAAYLKENKTNAY